MMIRARRYVPLAGFVIPTVVIGSCTVLLTHAIR
jgi:hypothetical protein